MTDRAEIRALLRKDARLMSPLVATAIAGSFAGNALLLVLWQHWGVDANARVEGSTVLWVMFPSLAICSRCWYQDGDCRTAVMFAFGQLFSMWIERPVLAFLAAPALSTVSLLPLFYHVDQFNADPTSMLLMIPILFFATWRLTGQWLEGSNRVRFTAQVVAYVLLAVALPILYANTIG